MLLSKDKTGVLLIDVQTALIPHIQEHADCVDKCADILKLANHLSVPVVVSEQYPKGLGQTVPELHVLCEKSPVFSKVSFSCYQDESIKNYLHQLKKTQFLLIGIEAHVCVLQTAIDMVEAGFGVYVVVDALGSRHKSDKKYSLKRMQQHGVELVTREMVFFEWLRQAGTDEFKLLSQSFLRKTHGNKK